MDIISNNLANVITGGYKKDRPAFTEYIPENKEQYPQDIIRNSKYNKTINASVKLDTVSTDFSMGNYKQTGNKLDFAIGNENVFFAVDTPFGIRFTRDGHFSLNEKHEVVTQDGFKVLSGTLQSISGITIQPEDEVTITEKGDIVVNGNKQNTIFLGEFKDLENLQKVGRNLYAAIGTEPKISENPNLKQGFLEMSNVNAVEEMVKMLEASRGYETYQKVIQTIDELNSKASNEIGRLA
jgi:flagellar basal-body rod protein FlgG